MRHVVRAQNRFWCPASAYPAGVTPIRSLCPSELRLTVYSDGVFEIEKEDGSMWKHQEFVAFAGQLRADGEALGGASPAVLVIVGDGDDPRAGNLAERLGAKLGVDMRPA